MASAQIELQHRFYDMLMQSQYWSPERMVDYQRSQLAQLLRHAKKNVAFYETRLDAVLKPNGDIDWDRWAEIPIVTRSDMYAHRDAMQAKELPPGHGSVGRAASSGSTGQIVTTSVNQLVMMAVKVNRWRAEEWQGIDWSGSRYSRNSPNGRPLSEMPDGTSLGRWGPPWMEESTGLALDIGMGSTVPDIVDFLLARPPTYVLSGAKDIQIYALEIERRRATLKLRACMTHGERVGEDDVEVIRRVFDAPVFELYSSKEGGQMGHHCVHRAALHVNAESLLLEIVDDDDRPLPVGEVGRVIITPFYSTAQPLIRYDQGDRAALGGRCSCGRTLPILKSVQGRTSSLFHHPDGTRVHRFYPREARAMLGCTMWQIAQVGPTDFEVRYVPIDGAGPPDIASATDLFRKTFFADASVTFHAIPNLRQTPAGKYLEYVNETRMQDRP